MTAIFGRRMGAALTILTLVFAADLLAQMNEGETVENAAVPENVAMAPIPDVPGLPRVLIIGDSISIGYTVPVRRLLEGKANVHRVPVNSRGSRAILTGIRGAKSWLGDGRWDVIHFNCGLWDAKVNWETGLPATSLDDYRKNLGQIVDVLRKTGATVLFGTTTPIPATLVTKPVPGILPKHTRLFDDIPARNEAAMAVMKEKGVEMSDLYAAILPVQAELQNPNDVHFKPKGSQILARVVAENVAAHLPPAEKK